MRFTLLAAAAAFAATAIAVPFEKRATTTDVHVVYVTKVVTATATTTTTHKTTTTTKATSTKKATSTAASNKTATAAGPAGTSYQEIAVYHHNIHRANHSAADVTWSDSLANTAAQIASSCVYAHNVTANGGGYGQNIAAGVQANNISEIITGLFYNGEVEWFADLYGQEQPSMTNFEHWGHFSQIVWKATTQIGCATQYCPNGLSGVASDVAPYFTVCNYESPGNYANEYGANIGSPKGEATANWNTGM